MGTNPLAGPSFNIGYAGASAGRSAAFLNVQADASADAPNPSMRFAIANSTKMIIDNEGFVGFGPVTNPTFPIQHESGAHLTIAGVWTSGSPTGSTPVILRLDSSLKTCRRSWPSRITSR